jgi:hypothetical protein
MRRVFCVRDDWGPASVNFDWGHNGAIRGASCDKMGCCDLNLSFGFGPILGKPAAAPVIRKGPVNKDRSETDKQVFV